MGFEQRLPQGFKYCVLDFETYCDLDINEVGAFKYAMHPSCKILFMSYNINNTTTGLWDPSKPWPTELDFVNPKSTDYTIAAFNATFEYLIWHYVGCREHSEYFKPIPLQRFTDLQAICARYRLPRNLKMAGVALGCDYEKLDSGTELIKKCCKPGGNPTKYDYLRLGEYCVGDTDVTTELTDKLPICMFPESEQRLWELTYQMNHTGVPVDVREAKAITVYLEAYIDEMTQILPDVTNGLITSPGQIKRIKEFCHSKGVEIPNVQAETVERLFAMDERGEIDLPESVKTALEIRAAVGMSSVRKFYKIIDMANNGWVQGNLNHHGGGTGRWTGAGFQYHNLPRAKVSDPEKLIQAFLNRQPIDNPVKKAKALVRPMIKAPKGAKLVVADYSSIENVFLAWFCNDYETLDKFRAKFCQYTDMAAFLYKKPYESIGADSELRQMGKVIILGCGYMMGKHRFQAAAADWGFKVTLAEADSIVKAYRQRYPKVQKMWYAYLRASLKAVMHKGKAFKTHKCTFKVVKDHTGTEWLRLTLPSGRALMYRNPRIADDKYGDVVKFDGVDPTTFRMKTIALTPNLLTENIVQGTSRDVLAHGKLKVVEHMSNLTLILSIHDEAGGLVPEEIATEKTLDEFKHWLCMLPDWCKDLPLRASGYIDSRFKKD